MLNWMWKSDIFLKPYLESYFHVNLKNGITIEFSCIYDGEIGWWNGCKKLTFIWKSGKIILETQWSRAGDVRIRAQILPLQECALKKMPPKPKAREAFFSIHMTGVGGFASQILTSYALDHCIYIKYSLYDLI